MLRRVEALLPWTPAAAIFGVILYEAIFEKAGGLILPGAAIGVGVFMAGLLVVSFAVRAVLWVASRVLGPGTR
jgi:hypothetical protein